jgi:4-amino-4-deoxy-L-arabinose transferase-like glycosyltransferase
MAAIFADRIARFAGSWRLTRAAARRTPALKITRWHLLLAGALLLGAVFRLIWGGNIEYKQDEVLLFRLVADHCNLGEWAELGMPSSQGVRVPALSAWVFYPFGHLFGTDEPIGLARGVQICSLAALLFLVLFALRCIPKEEREPWLWAAALIAVNPVAVLYHRKIWPPCMLPLFCMLFLACWWHRDRRWGALTWGFLGACLGQIHASGFLYALALVVVTFFADRRRRVRWSFWLAGSAIGVVLMAPWLLYILNNPGEPQAQGHTFAWHRWFEGKFWSHWVTEPMGLDLRGVFGRGYADYSRWPLLGDQPTFATAVLQIMAGLLGGAIAIAALVRWRRRRKTPVAPPQAPSSSTLLIWAGLWGYGLLLTFSSVRFYRHYMLITFPLMALWLARLAVPDSVAVWGRVYGRRLLLGLCLVNALSSALLLSYLHAKGGAPQGDFGIAYDAQARELARLHGNASSPTPGFP